jgi:hypothetical protein
VDRAGQYIPEEHETMNAGDKQKLPAGQSDCWTNPGGQYDPIAHWAIVDASTQYFSTGHSSSDVDPMPQ